MILLIVFEPVAQAQSGDWRAVERLAPGTCVGVKVEGKRRMWCSVEGATDTALICEVHVRRHLRTSTLTISRSDVEEVRLLPHPNQARDAEIGALIGAGAGATSGAINNPLVRGPAAFIDGLAGAGFGALVGSLVAVVQFVVQRSKVIYKR